MIDPTLLVLVVSQLGLFGKMLFDNRATRNREQDIADRLMAREERHRKWALEDRAFLASLGRTHAETLVKQVVAGHGVLSEQLAENTGITREVGEQAIAAYSEANNVNMKIERLAEHAAAALALEATRPTAQDLLPLSLAVALAAASTVTPKA